MSQMTIKRTKTVTNNNVSHLGEWGTKNQKRNAVDNRWQIITFLVSEKRKIKTFIKQYVRENFTFYVFVRLRFSFSRSIKFV